MVTEIYIYIKSDESNAYFIDNTTYKFKVQLKLPLYMSGKWKVALVQFYATEKKEPLGKADEGLYIYTDLCKESIVYGEERPLLRRLEKNSKAKWDYTFTNPFYVPVTKQELREIEIYIKRENDEDATDLMKPVYLTLHLKQYPFF
jgi:hypothetical protein